MLYLCLQSVIPADNFDNDIKTLYLNIAAASGQEVNHSDEVNGYTSFGNTIICIDHTIFIIRG